MPLYPFVIVFILLCYLLSYFTSLVMHILIILLPVINVPCAGRAGRPQIGREDPVMGHFSPTCRVNQLSITFTGRSLTSTFLSLSSR